MSIFFTIGNGVQKNSQSHLRRTFTMTSIYSFHHNVLQGIHPIQKGGNLKGDTFRALLTIIWKSNTQKHFPTTKKSYCQETFGVEGYHVCCVHVGTLHTHYLSL